MKIRNVNFGKVTLRLQITSRGGGIEIDLTSRGYRNHKMTAYQNYLGGGMLGSINNDCTIENWMEDEKLQRISRELCKYYHNITTQDSDFEELQTRIESAY